MSLWLRWRLCANKNCCPSTSPFYVTSCTFMAENCSVQMCKAVAIFAAKGASSKYCLEGVVKTALFNIHTKIRSICRFVCIDSNASFLLISVHKKANDVHLDSTSGRRAVGSLLQQLSRHNALFWFLFTFLPFSFVYFSSSQLLFYCILISLSCI